MVSRTFALFRRAIRIKGVWTTVVWSAILEAMSLLGAAASGNGSRLLVHPFSFSASSPTPSTNFSAATGIVALVLLVIGPFISAGIYGMFGAVVKGEEVGWTSFIPFARKLYGRSWGVILYYGMYMVAFVIVVGLLYLAIHAVAFLIAGLFMIGSFPWALRMLGGLFVHHHRWGQSFKASFRGGRYWGMLGTGLLGILGAIVGYGILAFLATILHGVGVVLYYLGGLFLSVLVGCWFFSLYWAENGSDGGAFPEERIS